MNTVRKEILHRSPKVFSNLALMVFFWMVRYLVLITLDFVNAEFVFLLQMGLLIVAGIFLVRGSFNALIIIDRLVGSFLSHLGIKEDWSKQRIFKDLMCIVAILLVAAAIFPLFNGLSNFEPILQQIMTYTALGLILLFVFDMSRNFYRLTEDKANSVVDRLSNSINNEDKNNGQ
jgi:hypothetical protein